MKHAELEETLRATLAGRAETVTRGPDWRPDWRPADDSAAHGPVGRRRVRWLAPVAAAAVVGVMVATVVAIEDRTGHRPAQPATHQPSISPTRGTPTSEPVPPPSPHAARLARLDWFGIRPLPGYDVHLRESRPGYRVIAVRRRDDSGVPIGCNGCESASDYIYVLDRGIFDAAKAGVRTWSPVDIHGSRGYLGTTKEYPGGRYSVPTIAWEYRPGSWAIVQGVTALGGAPATLQTVADAVRPTASVPVTLPFTLDHVPGLPVTDVMDDRSEGYAFMLTLGPVGGRTLDVTLWNTKQLAGRFDRSHASPRLIDGLPGWYDPSSDVAAARYHDGLAILDLSSGDGLTGADRAEFARVIDGLRWTNGDGRAPEADADRAIP